MKSNCKPRSRLMNKKKRKLGQHINVLIELSGQEDSLFYLIFRKLYRDHMWIVLRWLPTYENKWLIESVEEKENKIIMDDIKPIFYFCWWWWWWWWWWSNIMKGEKGELMKMKLYNGVCNFVWCHRDLKSKQGYITFVFGVQISIVTLVGHRHKID